jgi:uncharacterized protein (TIGR03000 family)
MSLKKNLFAALIVGCAVAMTANTSFAWGHWRGGSCGSSGGSWGGSWGSYGSSGSWGSCGSSGGSYGGGYAYSGYWGGYASTPVIYDGYVSSRPSVTVVESAPAVKTRLTIHVPAEAKISLAGVETKQTGEVRQFATTRLASGQNWDGYKVVAEIARNGQMVREERTIQLTGGQAQELTINFDSTKVAKN